MLRTQIYLPEDYRSQLTLMAKIMDVPMAEVIRKMIKAGIEKKEEIINKGNDLFKLSSLKIEGGPKDLSSKLDSYLYG